MGRLKTVPPRIAEAGRSASPSASWAHPERRQSRHARGYGTEWERTRERILLRDRGLCQPCIEAGRFKPGNAVDHKVPKFEGGTDDDSNLQTICDPCHAAKTAEESKRARGLT